MDIFLSKERPIFHPVDIKMKLEKLLSCSVHPTLKDAYDEIYKMNTDNQPYSRILAAKAFKWVLCSFRPLSANELADAVAVNTDGTSDQDVGRDYVLKICSNFIIADTSDIVQFAHLSVREYLEQRNSGESQTQEYSPIQAHTQSAETCLAYMNRVNMTEFTRESGFPSYTMAFPGYVMMYWPMHCEMASENRGKGHLKALFTEFTSGCEENPKLMQWITELPRLSNLLPSFNDERYLLQSAISSPPSPFFMACIWGFHEVINDSSKSKPTTVGLLNTLGETGLYLSSEHGHCDVARQLLERGADINARGGYYGNALQAASSKGHCQMVQLLLEKGADINAQGGALGGALQTASYRRHYRVVQLLLGSGADVNAQGGFFGNALQAASNGGHRKIVQLLLEKGACVNAQGGGYGNALQAASLGGHYQIVQLLLESGADVNAQGGTNGNALQAASYWGHYQIVQLLLEKGACVNAQGGKYGNALQAASRSGDYKSVQLLLEKGACVNAQGGEYGNALQVASLAGHYQIVQLLLESGADVNTQGGVYGNALQAASYGGHHQIVQLLLESGADVNTQGGFYDNALQAASHWGHYQTVQLLLKSGADVNAQGTLYGNALRAASLIGHNRVAQLLRENGAKDNPPPSPSSLYTP
jgi:ankyrin repeat protein